MTPGVIYMKKKDKIKKVIEEKTIFKISDTDKYVYYSCKGITNHVYDVVYHKGYERWSCNCDNIRGVSCYHIEAAKILMDRDEDNLE